MFISLTPDPQEFAAGCPGHILVNTAAVKCFAPDITSSGAVAVTAHFTDGTKAVFTDSLSHVQALLSGEPVPPQVAQLLRDLRAFVHGMSGVQSDDDDFIHRITEVLGDASGPPDVSESFSSGPIAEDEDACWEHCSHPGCNALAQRWELTSGQSADMVSYACSQHSYPSDVVAWVDEAIAAGVVSSCGIRVIPWESAKSELAASGYCADLSEEFNIGIICRLACRRPTRWMVVAVEGGPDHPTLVVSYPNGAPADDTDGSKAELAELVPIDDLPEVMEAGLRFKHPSIAHFRFAEECGFALVKYGPRDYEVQDVPKGWRLMRGPYATGVPLRGGEYVISTDRRRTPGRTVQGDNAHMEVRFIDGTTEYVAAGKLRRIEADDDGDSHAVWKKQKESRS